MWHKWVLGGTLGLLLLGATAGLALATGGPHGSYTATTDACAGCHRAHTAVAPKLLANTNTALCLTCHDGTSSYVNVSDGIYMTGGTQGTPTSGLNSGGFTYGKQDTTLTGAISGTITSRHSVQGTADYTSTATLWGTGAIGSGAGPAFDLYCTSCHDPHGSNNYRNVKTIVNSVAVTVTQTDEASKSYTAPTYYKAASTGQWEVASFCGACHTRYLVTSSASGETSSGDSIFTYRHRIEAPSGSTLNGVTYTFPSTLTLPVSSVNGGAPTTSPDNRSLVCLTCHRAHGTTATMTTRAGTDVKYPDGTSAASNNARSSLLRLDNRGVCENCHAK